MGSHQVTKEKSVFKVLGATLVLPTPPTLKK
jgi:hypothetical protein